MSAATLESVQTYLTTAYSPDVDFVDGEILERNVGERDHGLLQLALGVLLRKYRGSHNLWAMSETRLRISTSRYRIPDISVTIGKPPGAVLEVPPFIVIEILSRDDTFFRMRDRIDDYLGMGIPHIWVLDPEHRTAHICTRQGWMVASELRTSDPEIVLRLADVFADLDEPASA